MSIMGKDIGDVIAGSILRHTALALLTGGVGNVIAAAVDVLDVMDLMDASDAMDCYDASSSSSYDNYSSSSSDSYSSGGNGQLHFGSSQDVDTTYGPGYKDDHGNVFTYPTSGTTSSVQISPNDVLKK